MPHYIVDTSAETMDGPFNDRDSLVAEFASRNDEDTEDCFVATVEEDGTASLKAVSAWLESTEGVEA